MGSHSPNQPQRPACRDADLPERKKTMSDINRLVVAWVSAQQRHFYNSTRGIATVEQRLAWEAEAEQIIADHESELRQQIAAEIRAIPIGDFRTHDCLPSDYANMGRAGMKEKAARIAERRSRE